MATTDSILSPQSPVSLDDDGLWMKMDFNPVMDHTEMTQGNQLLISGERPQEGTEVVPPPPKVITRYYSVMDDEGEDDVFIPPPPPPYMAPPPPTGGSRGASDSGVSNSSVTVTNGAVGVTEAKANPNSLEWHHGEKQLMATQNKVDEGTANQGQINLSTESMDTTTLSEEKDSTPSTEQDQTTMEGGSILTETCFDPSERHQQSNTTGRSPGDQESNKRSEDIVMLCEESISTQENWTEENNMEEKRFKKRSTESLGESEDIPCLAETDSILTRETIDSNAVKTNAPTLPALNVSDSDFSPTQKKTCGPPELCKCNQNKTDTATNQPEEPAEVTGDDEEHIDTRSLNYNVTKEEWVRRDSASSEIPLTDLPISKDSSIDYRTEPLPPSDDQEGGDEGPDKVRKGTEQDGSSTIATDVEELLQRLQLVQQRQDVQQVSDSPLPAEQVVRETASETARDGEVERGVFGVEGEDLEAGGGDLTNEEEKGERRFNTDTDQGGKTNQVEEEKREKSESEEAGEKAKASSSTMPAQPDHHRVTRVEADNFDDDQSDSGVSADFSPVTTHETPSTQIPIPAIRHQLSTTETFMEREINQTVQGKQNLQRAEGLFNLTDNPDVLEIPFKTNILPKPLPTQAGPGQSTEWQFSEQKMQKEISQEIQRELVLVNQGKIPGGYSKGATRQLKETKMLFEAFQQDNTEGPTRHRKPPSTSFKGHVYPSVLERTRSLEMFSLKSSPISRAHSQKMYKSATSEREQSPENPRSKSPAGGSRDKTRLSPYPKQDWHLRLHRSMDSLNTDASTSNVDIGSKLRNRSQSPILKENPFFKLRPALALKPEVEKDIREAKEREEELRRQRCTLYGETKQNSMEGESSSTILTLPDVRKQSKGKLDRIWPPPSKKDQMKSGQTQQEPKGHKAGQRAPLWQRWESGLINGKPSKENN